MGLALLGSIVGGDPEEGDQAKSDPRLAPVETTKPAPADGVAAQAYRVVAEKDHSFGNTRSRVTLEIESELATTDVAALHTMMKAAVERHRRDWPDVVSVRLWGSYEKDPTIRNAITYGPDGCGWAGDKCTGGLWTGLPPRDCLEGPRAVGRANGCGEKGGGGESLQTGSTVLGREAPAGGQYGVPVPD